MPMPRKPDPEKKCISCDTIMHRKYFKGVLEDRVYFTKRKFCDRACMAAWMEGRIKSPTPQNSRRQSAKARKDACEKCGATKSQMPLHNHHVNENPMDNRPSNLMTLCAACHKRQHALNSLEMDPLSGLCAHCEKPSYRNGLCSTHITRFKRFGHPLAKKRKIGSEWVLMLQYGKEWFPFP